jgi:glycosyltransferase involved in cell wall biosynthesis
MSQQRIGLIVRGGVSPTNWSGIPAGLLRGLEDCGYEVIVCRADFSMGAYRLLRVYLRATRQKEEGWFVAPETMKLRELSARLRRRRLPPVNGWIVLGSENGVPVKGPLVTLDDMTVAEAQHHPWYFPPLPPRSWAYWQTNQGKLYRRAIRCFAASSWAAASISRDYGIASDKVEVVGFGQNLEMPTPASRDWSVPRFLFMGTDWDRKNGPAVLEAFTRIRREFPSAELSVVGKHPPLDLPGVHGYGRLRVDRPDDRELLTELFTTSTCLVVPSFLEPFGIVYAEAAAAGLAVIGTTLGGAPKVVGPAGLCVDPTDREGIESAMRCMADPAEAMRYGSAGPAHAGPYTWVNIAARMARALPGLGGS